MNTLRKVALCAFAFLWAVSAHASVNLIQNSDFNLGSDNLASGGWGIYESLPGWTNDVGNGIEVQFETVAKGKGKYVELDTTENSNMEQSLSGLHSGMTYVLSFDYFNRKNNPADTSNISVFFNDELLLTTNWYQQAWTTFTDSFRYSGDGTGVLTFLAVGPSDSYGGFVDNVSLKAVPIPGAAFLLGSALLGVVGIRRTRTV